MDRDISQREPSNEELAELFLTWRSWNDSLIDLTKKACLSRQSGLLSITHQLEAVRDSAEVAVMGHIHGMICTKTSSRQRS